MTDKMLREAGNMPGVSRPNYCPGGDKHSWDSYGDEWRCSFCPAVFRAARADSADAPEGPCSQCGGETYVVDLTRCRGCSNEFYTADQSRAASRTASTRSRRSDDRSR